jgi:hypothetical protein
MGGSSKEGSVEPRIRELVLILEVYEPEGHKRKGRSGIDQQVCVAINTWQEQAQAIRQYGMEQKTHYCSENPNARVTFLDLPPNDISFVRDLLAAAALPAADPRPHLEEIKQRLVNMHPPNKYPHVRAWVKGSETSKQAATLSAQARPNMIIQVLQFIRRCGEHGATRDEVLIHFDEPESFFGPLIKRKDEHDSR